MVDFDRLPQSVKSAGDGRGGPCYGKSTALKWLMGGKESEDRRGGEVGAKDKNLTEIHSLA